mmetsp:Transcript_120658/g.237221  ORF Transcript_120658/g.237221 Transcript_120658/m.237221 type:complete len:221 (+) Transcript_120658:66-728(+)
MFSRYLIKAKTLRFQQQINRNVSTEGMHIIKMPGIMGAKEGTINSWDIKVGDTFKVGDRLCEITLPIATIGIDAKESGILAKIIVDRYATAPADSDIAMYALNKESYMNFLAESRMEAIDEAKLQEYAESEDEKNLKHEKPDAATLMRVVRHLIQNNNVKAGSDFAKKLLSLARKGDAELLAAFEASYEGSSFNEETFDHSFFLENARDIVREGEDSDSN